MKSLEKRFQNKFIILWQFKDLYYNFKSSFIFTSKKIDSLERVKDWFLIEILFLKKLN